MASLLHLSPEASALQTKLRNFVLTQCQPAESEYDAHVSALSGPDRWTPTAVPPCIDRLKAEARRLGLWNLFLPPHPLPPAVVAAASERNLLPLAPAASQRLSNREYGILCETMGRSFLAPEACNCSAPDTGNMEVLLKFGTATQQRQWLVPLLDGTIRSAFLMTEPEVASSDATNIETRLTKIIVEDGPKKGGGGGKRVVKYVLNGRKWWSTGAMDPRCKFVLVLARMDYSHPSCRGEGGADNGSAGSSSKGVGGGNGQSRHSSKHGAHTVVLVPTSAPGLECVRPLTVFGFDDAPHGHAEVTLTNIELDPSSLIAGEGKGFEIAQSRLGPGRIHHCMRAVGLAARCYELMLTRTLERKTFGRYLWQHGGCQEMIADSASDLECARLLTLQCAADIDDRGARGARDKIASIKVAVPELTIRVVDRAVQVHGGAGVCGDFVLARALANLRTLRIADGPDAVHRRTVAVMEVRRAKEALGIGGKSRL